MLKINKNKNKNKNNVLGSKDLELNVQSLKLYMLAN